MPDFEIRVELPDKNHYPSFGRKRGSVFYAVDSSGEEKILVPVAVARSLKKSLDHDEIYPTSRAELFYYLGEIAQRCATQRLANLLNRRDYACLEVSRKLQEDGYTQQTIEELIEHAKRGRALDDQRYAAIYIRSKINVGWGPKRIEKELALKGIDLNEIEGWPEEFIDLENQTERAYELASKRSLSGKNDFQKLMRFLMSRGFAMSDAIPAVKRVLKEATETDK
ncbi:regulatory protein RecX [Atopobium sp. oral taxon 810]|uniref:regulatory protein RecX n=1 Tax=Atopobium sp. oral taxon 810 TaxID=712158 RepID=UPI0003964DAC|nr:regulatory protein RecX [Atopobium sp. oral taxon 810]ERI03869.1 regulatory protein RecX [Atopobium sp. oral taxon 810 str. F0209]